MQVAIKAHAAFALKASESLIPANLVLWGHLEGADWANLAIILDCVHNSRQAIQLCKKRKYRTN